jgi:pilus assembly protein Flp/PilA
VSIVSNDPRRWAVRNAGKKFLLLRGLQMLSIFRRLMKNEHGATAIEYTLIASLIAVAAIVAMRSVGSKVNGVLSNVASSLG